jgi:arsenical pump membrane protein
MAISHLIVLIFSLTVLSVFVNRGVIQNRFLNFLDIPYHISPLIGASLIYMVGGLTLNQVYQAIIGLSPSGGLSFLAASGPYSTILLFLSIAFISLTLEVSGFFRYLAVKVLSSVEGSGKRLFVAVFWVTAFFALFTSNDIIILTFTPFLIEFLDLVDVNAVPFLITEFFAANIFSMVMLIGNETNIIAATSHGIGFLQHIQYMVLPGLLGGLASFVVLYLIFREEIDMEYETNDLPDVALDRWEILSSALLMATLISLGVLSMQGFVLWHIGTVWAAITMLMFVFPDLVGEHSLEKSYLSQINSKMPWEVVPFLLGFFIMVQAFSVAGITSEITNLLHSLAGGGLFSTVFGIGVLSTLSANLLNNIPMTVLFSDVVSGYGGGATQLAAIFSLILGSNIGANITPIGALAGIMWMKMVNHREKRISFRGFFSYGWKVTSVAALVSLTALYLVIAL